MIFALFTILIAFEGFKLLPKSVVITLLGIFRMSELFFPILAISLFYALFRRLDSWSSTDYRNVSSGTISTSRLGSDQL